MISKPILNNVRLYKRRDISVDQQSGLKINPKNMAVKLPSIHHPGMQIAQEQHPVKYLKSRCMPLEVTMVPKRKGSSNVSTTTNQTARTIMPPTFENPQEKAKYNLISDYGTDIDLYLKYL
jgi:hypothetical protein